MTLETRISKLEMEVKTMAKVLLTIVDVCDNNFKWLHQKFELENDEQWLPLEKELRKNLEKGKH